MEELNLSTLSLLEAEPSEEEKGLINALLNSSITKLQKLYLNNNAEWFGHDEAFEYLLDFIRSQTQLKVLALSFNKLDSEKTEALFACLEECDFSTKIEQVTLKSSACLDQDSTVSKLAAFVEKAKALNVCSIGEQNHAKRKVKVTQLVDKTVEGGKAGQLKFTSEEDNAVLLVRPSQKTQEIEGFELATESDSKDS